MSYVPILDSTLAKLTEEEKVNLQMSLDSYFAVGYLRGWDEGFDAGHFADEDSSMPVMHFYPRAGEE